MSSISLTKLCDTKKNASNDALGGSEALWEPKIEIRR